MKQSDSIRLLQIIAWVGIIAIILIVCLSRVVSIRHVAREINMGSSFAAPEQMMQDDEPLGELGSHCGGDLRLPCRPGLSCSVEFGTSSELGVCQKPATASVTDPHQLHESCTASMPCAAALYCKINGPSASCEQIENGAPRIMSLAVEGAQFDQGVYRQTPGMTLTIRALAVNAKTATFRFRQGATTTDLGTMYAEPGGKYSGAITLTPGMFGSVDVIVGDPAKGFAMLSAVIGTKE